MKETPKNDVSTKIQAQGTLFTIGHGVKTFDSFIEELRAYDIGYLLDIRTKPYSKWSPHFNEIPLKLALEDKNIRYVYLGDKLGGLPSDRSCYDEEGKVIYNVIKEKDFFKEGLKRLITANEKGITLAIMCSEKDPKECHRTKLIGQELLKHGISLHHIITTMIVKSQEDVMNEITKGRSTVDLFGNEVDLKSRKSYK